MGLPIPDEYGFVSAGLAHRASVQRPAYIEPKTHHITVNCRTGERSVYVPPPPVAVPKKIISTPQPKPSPLPIVFPRGPCGAVMTIFAKKLAEAGYTIDGEPYRLQDLSRKGRNKKISKPRHVCMWLCRHIGEVQSWHVLGRAFGGYDHTTAIHGVTNVEKAFAWMPLLREIADAVIAEIQQKGAAE